MLSTRLGLGSTSCWLQTYLPLAGGPSEKTHLIYALPKEKPAELPKESKPSEKTHLIYAPAKEKPAEPPKENTPSEKTHLIYAFPKEKPAALKLLPLAGGLGGAAATPKRKRTRRANASNICTTKKHWTQVACLRYGSVGGTRRKKQSHRKEGKLRGRRRSLMRWERRAGGVKQHRETNPRKMIFVTQALDPKP